MLWVEGLERIWVQRVMEFNILGSTGQLGSNYKIF